MPKQLHDKLEREAKEKGLSGERKDAYVYGTLNKVDEYKTKKEHKVVPDNSAQPTMMRGSDSYMRCKKCGKPIGKLGGTWRHFK